MILASASPRRRQLLEQCGVEFTVFVPDAEELMPGGDLPLETLPEQNALIKAQAAAGKFPDELVLAADTMIIAGKRALGKPASLSESFEMLSFLSGKVHQVVTGIALVEAKRNICIHWSECAEVRFKTLTRSDIEQYTALVNTLDKAGAYAIQEHSELIIDCWSGDINCVIGLPLTVLKKHLQQLL